MKGRIERIDDVTNKISTTFGNWSAEQLAIKPTAEQWSAAEILQHIIQVNESYYPIFDAIVAGKYQPPFVARWRWFVNFLGASILKSVLPENRKKAKTLPIWMPRKGKNYDGILEKFLTHQAQMKTRIEEMQPYAAKGLVISSPANQYIVYKLEVALEIIAAHEERHLAQALETRKELKTIS